MYTRQDIIRQSFITERNSASTRMSKKRKSLVNLWTSLRLFRQLRYGNATFIVGKQKGPQPTCPSSASQKCIEEGAERGEFKPIRHMCDLWRFVWCFRIFIFSKLYYANVSLRATIELQVGRNSKSIYLKTCIWKKLSIRKVLARAL